MNGIILVLYLEVLVSCVYCEKSTFVSFLVENHRLARNTKVVYDSENLIMTDDECHDDAIGFNFWLPRRLANIVRCPMRLFSNTPPN